jgi:hypothetical protein
MTERSSISSLGHCLASGGHPLKGRNIFHFSSAIFHFPFSIFHFPFFISGEGEG